MFNYAVQVLTDNVWRYETAWEFRDNAVRHQQYLEYKQGQAVRVANVVTGR